MLCQLNTVTNTGDDREDFMNAAQTEVNNVNKGDVAVDKSVHPAHHETSQHSPVADIWRILGKGTSNGGLVVGAIIKPKLGLQPVLTPGTSAFVLPH